MVGLIVLEITEQINNSLETNLSSFTIQENSITNDKIERLSTLEKTDKRYVKDQKILMQDCREMLRSANKELKNISYQLSTVISDGEYHVKVMPKNPEELEIIEETSVYCKIEWKGMYAPAKFSITYRSKGDCTIFTSYKYSSPNKLNWDNMFKKPGRFLIMPSEKSKVFNNDYIYLWLHSKSGVTIQLLADFTEINDEAVSPKSRQPKDEAQIK